MSEEDFQVIDETVLLECDRVRMVPRQQPGSLALLRLKDDAFCFQWTEGLDETEAPRRIPLNEGLLMVPDEDSGTLLLLLPESKGVCWLFHAPRRPLPSRPLHAFVRINTMRISRMSKNTIIQLHKISTRTIRRALIWRLMCLLASPKSSRPMDAC
jgi:hypothetical protein